MSKITYFEPTDYSVGMIGNGFVTIEHNIDIDDCLDDDEKKELKEKIEDVAYLLLGEISHSKDEEEERIEKEMSEDFEFHCEKEYLIDCITREAIEKDINYIDLLEIRYTELWLKMHEIKGCVKDF